MKDMTQYKISILLTFCLIGSLFSDPNKYKDIELDSLTLSKIQGLQNEAANYYDSLVNKIEAYQDFSEIAVLKIIKKNRNNNLQNIINDSIHRYFPFNDYLKLFDKIYIDSSVKLDYVYNYQDPGGIPIIIILKKGDNINEFVKKFKDSGEAYNYSRKKTYLDYIRANKNDTAYIQSVLFAILFEEFASYWHYTRITDVVTSEKTLQRLIYNKNGYYRFNEREKNKIRKINPNIILINHKNRVIIKIIIYDPWRGFIRKTFLLNKKYPHKIRNIWNRTIVKHQCRIIF